MVSENSFERNLVKMYTEVTSPRVKNDKIEFTWYWSSNGGFFFPPFIRNHLNMFVRLTYESEDYEVNSSKVLARKQLLWH